MQVRVVFLLVAVCAIFLAHAQVAPHARVAVTIPPVLGRPGTSVLDQAFPFSALRERGYGAVVLPGTASRTLVQAASTRAHDAEVPCAALEIPLGTDKAILVDSAACAALAGDVRRAGTFALKLGVADLAFDCSRRMPLFNPSTPHYREAGYEAEMLAAHARSYGADIARAILETEALQGVYFFLGKQEDTDALWWPWLDGFLSAVPRNCALTIRLYPAVYAAGQRVADFREASDTFSRMLRAQLSDYAWERWTERGVIGIQMSNAGVKDARELVATRLLSQSSLVVNLSQVRPDESNAVRTSMDDLRSVGWLNAFGSDWYVFSTQQGATVVAPDGLHEPIVLRDRTAPVFIHDLLTGTRAKQEAREGAVTIAPSAAPVMIEELPVRDWVTPASLQVRWLTPLVDGMTRTPIQFGMTNFTDATLSGTIAAVPPMRFSVEPAAETLTLQPGDRYEARALLTGTANAGDALTLKVVLGLPGAAATVKSVNIAVLPQLAWAHNFNEPAPGHLNVLDIDGDGRPEFIGITHSGALFCLSHGGALWKVSRAQALLVSAVGTYWNGEKVIGAVDAADALYVFDSHGMENWQRPAGDAACALVFANLNPKRGEELVVGHDDGTVTALYSDGQELWSIKCRERIASLSTADRDGDGRQDVVVLSGTARDHLTLIDAHGKIAWESSLPGTVGGDVVSLDNGVNLVAALRNGSVAVVDLKDGAIAHARRLGENRMVGVTPCRIANRDVLLCAGERGLVAVSGELESLWSADVPCNAAPAVAASLRGAVVLVPTATQGIVALNGKGETLWKDTRAGAAIGAPPILVDFDGNGVLDCVYGSDDFSYGQ